MQNHLADACRGEHEEDDSRKKDRAQGRLPGDVHLEADDVGEVGVETHPWGQRDGIARHHAHHDGAESRRKAGGRGYGSQRHSSGGENGRVDQHDVGHGQERGDSGQNLGAPVGPQAREFKIAFQSIEHRRVSLKEHTGAGMQRDLLAWVSICGGRLEEHEPLSAHRDHGCKL